MEERRSCRRRLIIIATTFTTMKDSFEIKQDLTFGELFGSTLYVLRGWSYIRRLFIFLLVIWLIGIIPEFQAPAGTPLQIKKIVSYLLTPVLIILPFAVCLFIVCLVLHFKKPAIFKNNTYSFTHWGMVRTKAGVEFSRPWRELLRFKETPSFFLVYASEKDAHIIQKRMFNDPVEMVAFRSFLGQHLPHKR